MSNGQPDHQHDHAHGHEPGSLGRHGMVLVGQESLFLSHLPMFSAPHDYQVVLAVSLDDDVMNRLREDRASGASRLYTVKPEVFHITEFVTPPPGGATRTEFGGDLVSGHFEKGGQPIARGTTFTVIDVVCFRKLDFQSKGTTMSYVLFGRGGELFLAHAITHPPDFDQIVSVSVEGVPDDDIARYVREHVFADGDRFDGLGVKLRGRENSVKTRLRPGEKVEADGHVTGTHSLLNLKLEVKEELYLEEGELLQPARFEPTEEETAAGFGD